MEFGVKSYKDLLEFISYIFTSLSLIGILVAYIFSKKQIHFTVMQKCISDFREISRQKGSFDKEILSQYFELVNEEFFYTENNYLPIKVAIEWVDGMIDYLPFFDKKGEFLKDQNWNRLDYSETIQILNSYPRVYESLKLKFNVDFNSIYLEITNEIDLQKRKLERDKLIYAIIVNLNIGFCTKLRLKKLISSR